MATSTKQFPTSLFRSVDRLKGKTKATNQHLLQAADEAVDGALAWAKTWQNMIEHSLKKGLQLGKSQQELTFQALEGIKAIQVERNKRLRQLWQGKPAPVSHWQQAIDLKTIKGIGPKLEAILQAKGILSVQDLRKTPLKRLQDILDQAGAPYQHFDPQEWKKQAEQLVSGPKPGRSL